MFRKVFGQHPRVLAGLLNDLLARVAGCDELATLDVWIRRARTSTVATDVCGVDATG